MAKLQEWHGNPGSLAIPAWLLCLPPGITHAANSHFSAWRGVAVNGVLLRGAAAAI
jgi:hypothetical protein